MCAISEAKLVSILCFVVYRKAALKILNPGMDSKWLLHDGLVQILVPPVFDPIVSQCVGLCRRSSYYMLCICSVLHNEFLSDVPLDHSIR